MTPYTYYIKHVPTGLKYYGSKYGKDADPNKFWKHSGYFTSSLKVADLISKYGCDSFIVKVTKTFTTAEHALAHEYRFIERVKAVFRDDWLNENNGGKKFYNVGPDSPETKAKKSAAIKTPESNEKRRIALKGKPKHSSFGELLSKAQKNRPVHKEFERREKIKAKAIGRSHTDDTKEKLSNIVKDTRWIKRNTECKKVHVTELDSYLSSGWERGRILKKKFH